MVYGKALNQYKRTDIESATKLELVIMCYERAIQLLQQSKEHIKENEWEKKIPKVKKALDIISDLQCSLNMEQGGDIAKNLNSLYSYITKKLLVGDIRKDLSAFDESIKILSELNEAWKAIKPEEVPQENIYSKSNMNESGISSRIAVL
jgi:flagellar secretion chaperone FliS